MAVSVDTYDEENGIHPRFKQVIQFTWKLWEYSHPHQPLSPCPQKIYNFALKV